MRVIMKKINGAIVVFAKCPIPGASKTRLNLNPVHCADIARAMLSDIITSISQDERLSNTMKFLVYAPNNDIGEQIMIGLLSDLNMSYVSIMIHGEGGSSTLISESNNNASLFGNNFTYQNSNDGNIKNTWFLLPMSKNVPKSNKNISDDGDIILCNSNTSKNDLTSSDLGSKLADALINVRSLMSKLTHNDSNDKAPVVFLGMDAPEIPIHEVVFALNIAQSIQYPHKVEKSYMNPAIDGGYGMLCVPYLAPPSIFEGVRWSTSLTALSQMKALTDHGVDVILGSVMNDIDEPEDLMNLALRLCSKYSYEGTDLSICNTTREEEEDLKSDRLSKSSELCQQNDENEVSVCPMTFEALLNLGFIHKMEQTSGVVIYNIVMKKFEVINKKI